MLREKHKAKPPRGESTDATPIMDDHESLTTNLIGAGILAFEPMRISCHIDSWRGPDLCSFVMRSRRRDVTAFNKGVLMCAPTELALMVGHEVFSVDLVLEAVVTFQPSSFVRAW